jgi:signal peptide peptidase SppA
MSDRLSEDAGRYEHLLAFVFDHPWALDPPWAIRIAGILARRVAGEETPREEIAAAVAKRPEAGSDVRRVGDVAVLGMYGVIAPRMNLFTQASGGTTFEQLSANLAEAVASQPRAIVLDIDSPGGNVAGASEFAHEVLAARAQVPVVAVANHTMASAAYWVAACATELVAAPSAMVGSVGVLSLYEDVSAALEKRGIKRDVISAGRFKGEGADGGPLSAEARAHRQAVVDQFYERMTADIGLGRGLSGADVREKFGEGRLMTARDGLAAGLVTRVGTLSETLTRYGAAPAARRPLPDPTSVTAQERLSGVTAQERAARIAEAGELLRLRLAADLL